MTETAIDFGDDQVPGGYRIFLRGLEPIYQTTSFVFNDTDHAAALFNLEQAWRLICADFANSLVGSLGHGFSPRPL